MRALVFLLLASCAVVAARAGAASCPPSGGTVEIRLVPPIEAAAPSNVTLSGELIEASCEGGEALATTYALDVECANDAPCTSTAEGLVPGLWVHRITVQDGLSAGQRQARRGMVLDRSGGTHEISWKLFRTVFTVTETSDSTECEGCMRRALEVAAAAETPMLIAFDMSVIGDILLSGQLPELAASEITIDAIDFDGLPYRRGIDVVGLARSALRITGASNHVVGLRLANSGGDADVLLIDGAAANLNLVESVQIVGRSIEVCERRGLVGCLIDGECSTPDRLNPNGDCGDDGIAVREDAGRLGANHLVDVDVTGAYDKGIKVSEGAIAVIERSRIHGNSDGGIQATLGGTLSALENLSESNRGTRGANGIAANGPRLDGSDPASLTTRGNMLRHNALRGLSVRSLSTATLRDDYVCGNGTENTAAGFGIALLDAAGFSAAANARGLAVVHNLDGGVTAMGMSRIDLGTVESPGGNAFGFNGLASNLFGPKQLRNQTSLPVPASGNHWEDCGPTYDCAEIAVLVGSIYSPDAVVDIIPAEANAILPAPVIHEIRPGFARAGDLVRIYGEGFDAIGAAALDPQCDGAGRPCQASDPNCVIIDRQGAEIVAATPTMLVIRAPFTCVAPVKLAARTRHSRGFARTTWCRVED